MTGTESWQAIHDQAEIWIREAGKLLKQALRGPLDIQTKSSPDDLVTNMDKKIEQFFVENIHQYFPDHHIVSEEGFGDDLKAEDGVIWLIDPIDGTMNFIHQKRHFSISIGVYENGIGRVALIYDVIADDLYHCVKGHGAYINDTRLEELGTGTLDSAIVSVNATWLAKNRRIDPEIVRPIVRQCRGTRSYGSAAIELAYVAGGALDVYITMRLSPWDYGAGLILVEEVGGIVTRMDGSPIDLLKQNSLLVGRKGVHEEIIKQIREGIASGKFIEQLP